MEEKKTFTVVKGVRKASFAPFDPSKLETVKSGKGRKMSYLVVKSQDGLTHIVGIEELCQLQEDNQKEAILINSAGKIAKEGEEASLTTEISIGRNSDGILEIL